MVMAVLLVVGFLLVSCDMGNNGNPANNNNENNNNENNDNGNNDNGNNEDNTDPKKLVITGISGISSSHIVVMLWDDSTKKYVAGAFADLSENVTFQLKNSTPQGGFDPSQNWTGTGKYRIGLWESTGGNFSGNPKFSTQQEVNFSTETTTIAWTSFSAYQP